VDENMSVSPPFQKDFLEIRYWILDIGDWKIFLKRGISGKLKRKNKNLKNWKVFI